MPLLTAASSLVEEDQQLALPSLDLSTFSGVIAGGILTAIGFITIIAGTVIVVIDSRKRGQQKSGGSSGGSGGDVADGGTTYRKD
jgi:hypothetical protein